MELEPIFEMHANGADVTQQLMKNNATIQFKDEDGSVSDELTIKVYGDFARPKYQDELKLWLGYKESGLFYCGTFKVQTTERLDGYLLNITATGADFSESLKQKKNKSFENMSIKEICKMISAEHGLSLKSDFEDIFIIHQAQNNESDLHFLKRLAGEFNAIFSIKNNTLVFLKKKKDGQKSDELPEITVDAKKVSNLSIKHSNKLLYNSCKAVWHDTKQNKVKEIIAGSGSPQLLLEGRFKNEAEAKIKATAKLEKANQGIKSGSFKSAGLQVYAGSKLNLINTIGGEDDESFSIKSVNHSFNESGWTTSVEFEN